METPEELVARLTAPTDSKQCGRKYGEHYCVLFDCPSDDPDHTHVCGWNDFDITEGEFQSYRLGKITEDEFRQLGWNRAMKRFIGPIRVSGQADYWERVKARSVVKTNEDVRKMFGINEG